MFEIKEEIKEFVAKQKDNLRPLVILRLVEDVIQTMLSLQLPKAYILQYINNELNVNINYQTFISYIKSHIKNKNKKTIKEVKDIEDVFNLKKDNEETQKRPVILPTI